MNQCDELMLESIEEFNYIDDIIFSESVFYTVDKYIDDEFNRRRSSIFESDSSDTTSDILNDIVLKLSRKDEDEDEIPDYEVSRKFFDGRPMCDKWCDEDSNDFSIDIEDIKNCDDGTDHTDCTDYNFGYDDIFGGEE